MKLSIVATLYRSAAHLGEFHRRISAEAAAITDDYELVLVNDGSPDDSLAVAQALLANDSHIVIVDLSRNFGHHKAMMTGLAHARGEYVFLIDSDLEEPPELLSSFMRQLKEQECDVVFGVQRTRKGKWFERISGQLFYRLFRFAAGISLVENFVTARLMTRDYVNALLQHQERELFIGGLWHITGFDQRTLMVEKKHNAVSTYTLGKKIALFTNAITSFSNRPLILIFYVGLCISLIAGAYVAWLAYTWALHDSTVSGWTSLIASVWMLGGLIILFLGVIGIYLAKIFNETKQRPYTIVRRVYGRDHD